MALKGIVTTGALLERAVRATVAGVALAANRAGRIPGVVVHSAGVRGADAVGAVLPGVGSSEEGRGNTIICVVRKVIRKLAERLAGAMAVAVVRADRALAGRPSVASVAGALACAAVALTAARALDEGGDMVVVCGGRGGPGASLRARACFGPRCGCKYAVFRV